MAKKMPLFLKKKKPAAEAAEEKAEKQKCPKCGHSY
jgi:hypothetical protein